MDPHSDMKSPDARKPNSGDAKTTIAPFADERNHVSDAAKHPEDPVDNRYEND
ncbi:hypothetical protein Fuma_00291 [Fuerstiella marisgermanici]|uniref:Uncharacterized protein n=1 Tax=Fuerstiella marisgermanici TaxID=1891926 RepID=A0A1P8W9H9_9PLAN|nr:hypothetical protein Fuma_00291 [Fuerstiella marisgermanici]